MTNAERRERLRKIIFEADTPAGRLFDVGLLWAIGLSVMAVMLESVTEIRARHGLALRAAEWSFTGLFTVEYALRLYCAPRKLAYARSFFGVVDLLAIVPTYLSLVIPGSQSLLTIRALRLLRVFRVLKLAHYLGEANILTTALRSSRRKVTVFLGSVLVLVMILGSAMYLIEGSESGFTSIPRSVYWAIVTLTTVGYGDITPRTVPGQVLASLVMIMGYAIIAVPTGIVTAEIVEAGRQPVTTRTCMACLSEGHRLDARYCRNCGEPLELASADDAAG
jgi:voltage-gated potassium channel